MTTMLDGLFGALGSIAKGAIANPTALLYNAKSVINAAASAHESPEKALSAFFVSLSTAMGYDISLAEAQTLARMVVRTIKRGRKR